MGSNQIRRAAGLTIGAMIYSAGLNLFLVPNNIIDGGVTGMSLLLSELAGIPFSVLIVLLNIPFFILGYKQLGLRLAVSSMFAIIVLSFWSHIFLHFGKRRFCFYMEQRHVFPYCLLYLFPHDGCRFHGA